MPAFSLPNRSVPVNAPPKPIETLYAGQRYRSRLEARYAVFFERLNLPFQYEPEGFDLENGTGYVPDFWMPSVRLRDRRAGCLVETKPTMEAVHVEEERFEQFVTLLAPLVVFAGSPPGDCAPDADCLPPTIANYDGGYQFISEGRFGLWWDNRMVWIRCYECGRTAIENCEKNDMVCPTCGARADDIEPGLLAAARESRRFRFDWK